MITFPRTLSGILAMTLRMLLGALFVYSGWQKAQDPAQFLLNVRSFQILSDPYAAWLAMGLPWLEIIAGTALVSGLCVEGGLAVLAGVLGLFLWAILDSWHRGLDIDCGCFGKEAQETSYLDLVIRDLLLMALTVGLIIQRAMRRRQHI